MNRSTSWTIGRPVLRLVSSRSGRVTASQRCASQLGGDKDQLSPQMPKLSNRMRRYARAHPEVVAEVSPHAVEDTKAQYDTASNSTSGAATAPRKAEADAPKSAESGEKSARRKWSKSEYSSIEFYNWLNTYHHAKPEEEDQPEKHKDDWEYDEYDGYDGEEKNGTINVGKEFLVQRAKPPGYDVNVFGPEMLANREKVLAARSRAQLRKAHERLRLAELALREQASAYRTVALGWENPVPQRVPVKGPSGGSIKQKTARAGEARGGGTPGATANRVMYGPSETYAYVFHRMMPAYSVLHRVLSEVRHDLPDLNPTAMLDFGSGPGTAALAAWDVWGGDGGNVEDSDREENCEQGCQLSEIRLVEESQSMMDASKIMLEPLMALEKVRVGFGSSLLEEAKSAARGQKGGKKFELVVAASSLSHLTTHTSRAAATAVLWNLVSPGGALVIVEDGSAKGSHTVRSARQMVLSSAASGLEGATGSGHGSKVLKKVAKQAPYIVGPCRHDKECPLKSENGEMCRFTQKVPWNAADVVKCSVRSVLFSYVVIRKGAPELKVSTSESTEPRKSSSSSVDLLKAFRRIGQAGGRLGAAMESLGTEGISDESLKREDWARLIRKPIKGQGHVILDLCTPDGDLQRKIESKKKWKGATGIYIAARKSQLGGLWPYLDNVSVKSPVGEKAGDHEAEKEWDGMDEYDPDNELDSDDEGDVDGRGRRRKRRQFAFRLDATEGSGFGGGGGLRHGAARGKAERRRDNVATAEAAKYRDLRSDN